MIFMPIRCFKNMPARALPALIAALFLALAPACHAAQGASGKEELDLKFTPDGEDEAALQVPEASPDGIKAGIIAVKEEDAAAKAEIKIDKAEPSAIEPVKEEAAKAAEEPEIITAVAKTAESPRRADIMPAPAAVPEPSATPPAKSFINKFFSKEVGFEKMAASPAKAASPAADTVKERYSLRDCIDIAVKNSIPIQVAEKSLKLADMRVMETRRNMLPSATITYDTYNGEVQGRKYIGRKQYIEGQQPVFHGGELYYAMKQAEVNREITRTERAKVKNELVLQVKKGYYSLAKAKDNLDIQRELSGKVERIYEMVRKQDEANIASKLEVLNVQSQSSQIWYQLASAEGDVSVAELILKQAMNVEPEFRLDIKSDLVFDRIEIDYDKALSAALVNRPEVRINTLIDRKSVV